MDEMGEINTMKIEYVMSNITVQLNNLLSLL